MDLSHSKFGPSTLGGVSVHATRYTPDACLCCLALLLLPLAMRAGTIEHPGILHKDDNCSSCRADKAKGKSVHSAMEIPVHCLPSGAIPRRHDHLAVVAAKGGDLLLLPREIHAVAGTLSRGENIMR
jgi:hypothetical protein